VRLLHAVAFSNQGNFFENATTCRKRMLKTRVATQLKVAPSNNIKNAKKNLKEFFTLIYVCYYSYMLKVTFLLRF